MYGKFDNYFNEENKKFHNSIWIELIGFDKDAEENFCVEHPEIIDKCTNSDAPGWPRPLYLWKTMSITIHCLL